MEKTCNTCVYSYMQDKCHTEYRCRNGYTDPVLGECKLLYDWISPEEFVLRSRHEVANREIHIKRLNQILKQYETKSV